MHHYPILMLQILCVKHFFFHLVLTHTLFLQKNADFRDNNVWKQFCHGSLGSIHFPEVQEYMQMAHRKKNTEVVKQERRAQEDKKKCICGDLCILSK